MNNKLVEIVFILDRSGSMAGLEDDTIGGFNALVSEQKEIARKFLTKKFLMDSEVKLTTVLFDDKYEILHNGVNINDVKPLTRVEYNVRGRTALLDAVGKTITAVGDRLSNTAEADRPAKIMFVITTDGQENASREYSLEKIKSMIEHQRNVYKWEFVFLGADIDSVTTAAGMGINTSNAKNYTKDSVGTQSIYSAVSKGLTDMRGTTASAKNAGDITFDSSVLNEVK